MKNMLQWGIKNTYQIILWGNIPRRFWGEYRDEDLSLDGVHGGSALDAWMLSRCMIRKVDGECDMDDMKLMLSYEC